MDAGGTLLAPGARLHWGAGNELHVVAGGASPAAAQLTFIRWGALDAAQRRVAHDTLPLFNALLAKEREGAVAQQEWWREVLQFSRAVRRVLGAQEAPRSVEELVRAPRPPQQAALWELLEACFVEQGRVSGSVAAALCAWLARNYDAAEEGPACAGPALRRLHAAAAAAPRPEEAPGYWAAAAQAAALGWDDVAADLLRQHSAWAAARLHRRHAAAPLVQALEAAVELLQLDAPPRRRAADASRVLAAAELWARVGGTPSGDGLHALLRVLAGDDAALDAHTGSWVELLVAQLRHAPPGSGSTPRDLARAAAAAAARKRPAPPGAQPAGAVGAVLRQALERNGAACVALCSAHCDEWFNAHAPELLAAAGPEEAALVRGPLQGGDGRSLADRVRLELAACCAASGPCLTHVAADYAAAAGRAGTAALRVLLLQAAQPGCGEARTAQLAALARRHSLPDVERAICAAAGAAAEAAGQLGAAAAWHARCGDDELCGVGLSRVAERRLPAAGWRAPDANAALLDSLGDQADATAAGAVAFLRGFGALQAHLADARAAAASVTAAAPDPAAAAARTAKHERAGARVLRALLQPDTVPRCRWPALLFAAVPLLEGACGALGAEDERLLAARLEELQLHAWGGEAAGGEAAGAPADPAADAQLEAVRLALARHAARVF